MKVKTEVQYICEGCGASYGDSTTAMTCEQKHKRPIGVSTADSKTVLSYNPVNQVREYSPTDHAISDLPKGYYKQREHPLFVEVWFENGSSGLYRFEGAKSCSNVM